MQNLKNLITIALAVAVIALCLSLYNTYLISKTNKDMEEIEEITARMETAVENFEALAPEFETLEEFLPRIEQFLLSIPPVPTND